MSALVTRRPRRWPAVLRAGITRKLLLAPVLAVTAMAIAVIDLDWPRWVHNLADLLQIVTAAVAMLALLAARPK